MAKNTIFTESISVINVKDDKLDQHLLNTLQNFKHWNKRPNNRSNVGGFQTDNIITDYTASLIGPYICNAMKDLTDKKFKVGLLNMWINENYKGSRNRYHLHPLCTFSGVYYLKTPPKSGCLTFYRGDNSNAMLELSRYYQNTDSQLASVYEPKKGMLIIFPSHLAHSVDENLSEENRISVSFNFNLV
jgi:uncharacterized protein (TIGR02466 family)